MEKSISLFKMLIFCFLLLTEFHLATVCITVLVSDFRCFLHGLLSVFSTSKSALVHASLYPINLFSIFPPSSSHCLLFIFHLFFSLLFVFVCVLAWLEFVENSVRERGWVSGPPGLFQSASCQLMKGGISASCLKLYRTNHCWLGVWKSWGERWDILKGAKKWDDTPNKIKNLAMSQAKHIWPCCHGVAKTDMLKHSLIHQPRIHRLNT